MDYNLQKLASGDYSLVLDGKTLILKEDTILDLHLLNPGRSFDLTEVKNYDQKLRYADLALNYALKYAKNSYELSLYLEKKGLNRDLALEIVEILKEKGHINDYKLARLLALEYARKGNGPLLIKQKLLFRHYSDDEVAKALAAIDSQTFEEGKAKLLAKTMKKYDGLPKKELRRKIKEQFYKAGYQSYEEEFE